ncbi:hypothetical protein [Streptomyces pacificus]|uniref:Uncharacterized protein n=1 Tax=Streptomyces pacificus TaxID=2705029 RepID=A0A6A0B0I8_9ACTN|nr:hypothetical protein [Streptomyces pacificus]GFH38228.1 hypothetical protein SCWH03_44700 [Streptomyces pacificus]
MSTPPEFSLVWKWGDPPADVRDERTVTWADVEMSIGTHTPLTTVEDPATGTVRPYTTGSLYPLAEWIAFNWWSLVADARPGTQISQLRFAYKNGVGDQRGSWWQRSRRHIMRAACDGFRWPDVLFVPEGRQTRIVWMPDDGPDTRPGPRYLARGNVVVGSEALTETLRGLVDAVVARLTEWGISDTPLQEEWTALRATGEDEAAFCRAAARLGLDPYTEAEPYADVIQRVVRELPESHAFDFLNGVRPERITDQLAWLERAREVAGTAPVGRPADPAVAELREVCADIRETFFAPGRLDNAWHLGYELARRVRSWAGVGDTERFETDALLSYVTEQTQYVDRGLVAFGRRDGAQGPVLVSGRRYTERPRRFLQARAISHFICDNDPDFLIVAAHTQRQHLARGFALELLAPAQGVAELLGRPDGLVTAEDVEQISEDYGAGTIVVEHQLDNQVLAQDFPFTPVEPTVPRAVPAYPLGTAR